MKSSQFIGYLEDPAIISEVATSELAKLTDQFPFFQSARLLYLKGLHLKKSIEYPKALKVAAAHAIDRRRLYELIMQEDLHKQIRLVEEFSESKVSGSVKDISPLEAQVLQEAVNAAIQLEVNREISKSDHKTTIQKVRSSDGHLDKHDKVSSLRIDRNAPRSFSDWLRAVKRPEPESSDPDENDDQGAIIDRFIRQSPRIGDVKDLGESGRQPFFSPMDTARLSLVDDPSFVTETLAGIYEAQGYLKKAMQAFELLSLKFPEKKSIFAARIQQLEQQMNADR